jgi:hypothetical protein
MNTISFQPVRANKPSNATVLSTFKAKVQNKVCVVEQIKLKAGKQAIAYTVNGKLYFHDSYWNLNPIKVN